MRNALPLFALALLAGCGGGASEDATKPNATAEVRVAPATLGSASDTVTIYGTTESSSAASHAVIAPAEAIVDRVLAPTGTAVGAGQAILTLRPSRTTRTDIVKAATEVATATAAYRRAVRMRADGLVSNADVEAARAAMTTAIATRANLGIGGGGLALRAPVAGTVRELTAKPGDQLAAGATAATIATRGDLRARFGIDPSLAVRVRTGEALHVEAIDGSHAMDLPVVGVDPQVDATTRLASIYTGVPAGLGLGVGQPLRGSISVGATSSGVSIPYAALLDDGGRTYVFVVKGGVAKSVDVTPGNSSGDRIQILKGLNLGDEVVVEGGTALEDGMKVSGPGVGAKK